MFMANYIRAASAPVLWLIYCLVNYKSTRDRLYKELCKSGIANGKEPVAGRVAQGHLCSRVQGFCLYKIEYRVRKRFQVIARVSLILRISK